MSQYIQQQQQQQQHRYSNVIKSLEEIEQDQNDAAALSF
jgi:uncharacterized protein (UPF0147 family)